MILEKQKNHPFLIMIFPLVFVLMPSPSNSTLQSLVFPAIAAILLFVGLKWYLNAKLTVSTLQVLIVLFLYAVAISLSITFSINKSLSDLFQIAKPFYFAVIFLFGIFAARLNDEKGIIKGLLTASYIILLVQLITGIAQLMDLSIFDIIYSGEKSRPFGRLMRLVGTTGNPNTFGWIVIQSAVIIALFEVKKFRKWLWLGIAIVLLVFSGSRSMLLMFPVILIGTVLLETRKNLKFYFMKFPVLIAILLFCFYVLVQFLEKYQDVFPYLGQLLSILNSGSLESVNSFSMRTTAWEGTMQDFTNQESLFTYLFGLGAGTYGDIDNAYLYALTNTGLFGLIITLGIFVYLLFIFKKVKNIKIKVLGYQYIIFSLILGLQADTISGWTYPTFALFYTGIAIVIIEKQRKQDDYVPFTIKKTKKRRKRYKIVW